MKTKGSIDLTKLSQEEIRTLRDAKNFAVNDKCLSCDNFEKCKNILLGKIGEIIGKYNFGPKNEIFNKLTKSKTLKGCFSK